MPTMVGIEPGCRHAARPLLRIAGKGLPEFGGRATGDLYVRLRVAVPQQLTAEQRRLYEQLRALQRK